MTISPPQDEWNDYTPPDDVFFEFTDDAVLPPSPEPPAPPPEPEA